jgi:putative DNA primase/helicase
VEIAPLPMWLLDLAAPRVSPPPSSNGTNSHVPLGIDARHFVVGGAPVGSQRSAAVAAARNYLSAGYSVEETIAAIWQGLERSRWDPQRGAWTAEHARRLVESVNASPPPPLRPLRKAKPDMPPHRGGQPGANGSNGNGVHPQPPVAQLAVEVQHESPSRRWSDMWNGEQFAERYGEHFRYCGEGGWFHYDRGAWREDRTGLPMRSAKRMVREMLREAAKSEDDDEAKGLASWAVKCHASAKLESILRVAQTEKRIAITITDFDQDPVLLNVSNGTLDLRTAAFRPHRSEDLLSKQCPVEYDPTAGCSRFLEFLDEVFGGDASLIEYVQRLFGFSATGLQNHHLLVFLWGAGRNGKTTLLEAVAAVLGDYARSLSSEVLLMSRENGDYNVAQLRGVRLAITSETGQHRRLDESRVKLLTGGDTLPARHPYGRPFTFAPTHHLWTMSNYKPQIEGMDHGIWSRVKLIEFANRFDLPPEGTDPATWQPGPHIRLADPTLPARLLTERPGILNWLVQGAAAALRDGLREPASVTQATDNYRQQMDILGGFLDECCDVGAWLSDTSKRLYAAYRGWCSSNGVEPVSVNKFGMLLSERGSFIATRPTSGDRERRWTGVQVRSRSDGNDD